MNHFVIRPRKGFLQCPAQLDERQNLPQGKNKWVLVSGVEDHTMCEQIFMLWNIIEQRDKSFERHY